MLRLPKILLTGYIGSGKSTVGKLLETYQAYHLQTDLIVHKLLSQNTGVGKKVQDLLGLRERSHLAQQVFSQPKLLKQLEDLLHPEVIKEIKHCYKKVPPTKCLFVCEVPLFIPAIKRMHWDCILWVEAPSLVRWARCTKRSETFFHQKEKRQAALFKRYLPSSIERIDNSGDIKNLEKQLDMLFKNTFKKNNHGSFPHHDSG